MSHKKFAQLAVCAASLLVTGGGIAAPTTTVAQHFDFSSSPITMTAAGDPIILEVDFQQHFTSFENIVLHVVSPTTIGSLAYKHGILYPEGAATDPCCTSPLPFGVGSYVAQVAGGGGANEFSHGLTSSADMIDRAFVAAANDTLDGAFRMFLWLTPECGTPSALLYGCSSSAGTPLVVSSIDVILWDPVAASAPEPPLLALLGVGLASLFAAKRHKQH